MSPSEKTCIRETTPPYRYMKIINYNVKIHLIASRQACQNASHNLFTAQSVLEVTMIIRVTVVLGWTYTSEAANLRHRSLRPPQLTYTIV